MAVKLKPFLLLLLTNIFLLLHFAFKPLNDDGKTATKHSIKPPIKGFILGLHDTTYHYDYGLLIQEIKATGSDWIGINVKFYQANYTASSIKIPPKDAPFWLQLRQTIKQAKQEGLKVMLFPIVLLEDDGDQYWRGSIVPSSKQEWYASYKHLYKKLSVLAQQQEIDLLSVGSELCSLQGDTKEWLGIIDLVKSIYDGSLTYSANWDASKNIEFHSQLDFLGISGYFELTTCKDPSYNDLLEAWRNIKEDLIQLQQNKDIPLIFTEIGYTSLDGTNMHPWNYYVSETIDLIEQYNCYAAFIDTWKNDQHFNGVFFYDWFGVGGFYDGGYTIRDKPTVNLVEEWFGEQEK